MRRLLGKGGQSTLEYLIILFALVLAIEWAATYIKGRMNTALNRAADKIVEETDTLMATKNR